MCRSARFGLSRGPVSEEEPRRQRDGGGDEEEGENPPPRRCLLGAGAASPQGRLRHLVAHNRPDFLLGHARSIACLPAVASNHRSSSCAPCSALGSARRGRSRPPPPPP